MQSPFTVSGRRKEGRKEERKKGRKEGRKEGKEKILGPGLLVAFTSRIFKRLQSNW